MSKEPKLTTDSARSMEHILFAARDVADSSETGFCAIGGRRASLLQRAKDTALALPALERAQHYRPAATV